MPRDPEEYVIRINLGDLKRSRTPESPDFSKCVFSPNLEWKLSKVTLGHRKFWISHKGRVFSIPYPPQWATRALYSVFTVCNDGRILACVKRPHTEIERGQQVTMMGGLEQTSEVQQIDLFSRILSASNLGKGLLLDFEGWGSTQGDFVVCRRVGEGRPLCLFDSSTGRKLFDIGIPYDYPVQDAFVDENTRKVWLSRFASTDTSRGPFEISLDTAGSVVDAIGDGVIFRRLHNVPSSPVLPRNLAEYDAQVVSAFYDRLRDLRTIGRGDPTSFEGLKFEAKMIREKIRAGGTASLGNHLDNIRFLLLGIGRNYASARDALSFLEAARGLDQIEPSDAVAVEVAAALRGIAEGSKAYQRHKKQRQIPQHETGDASLPIQPRVIDYLWETGEVRGLVGAAVLRNMLRSAGVNVPSKARAAEVWELAWTAPPVFREWVARHLGIAIDKPEDWYLKPLRLDPTPLNALQNAFHDDREFPSGALERGRAQTYHCQAYLVDSARRKVFLGYGRNYHPDRLFKDLVIDGCVWLEGGYYGIRLVPRITFWRRTVSAETPEEGEEYDAIFRRFLNRVRALGFTEDPDMPRPIRIPSEGLGMGISISFEFGKDDESEGKG